MRLNPLFYTIPFLFSSAYCEEDEEETPLPIGILAFPTSQQLCPLISFGQNILDQGQLQVYYYGASYVSSKRELHDAVPNYVHAFTDDFSIYVEFPVFAISYRDREYHTTGMEDTVFQSEYSYYSNEGKYFADQATLIAGVAFPTGSATVTPPTGFGNLGFLIGTTLTRTTPFWYYFTSFGSYLMSSEEGNRTGDMYLYQAGIGRYITTMEDWLFCLLVEVNGQYQERNKINYQTVVNSGGSSIFITPSIWFSSCNWRFQLGAGYAVQQHLYGEQSRLGWLFALNFGYTFW